MTIDIRDSLIDRLDKSRQKLVELLPGIDPVPEIYPSWTIKQMLAHITGWDDVWLDALQAHIQGYPLAIPTIHSLDQYNEMTVASREGLNYDQTLEEFHQTRQALRELIRQIPEDKILEPITVPWGGKETLDSLVEIFSTHEIEHAHDIKAWLKQPARPPGKVGN